MKWFFLCLGVMGAALLVSCATKKPEAPTPRLAELRDFDPALLAREIFNASNRARQNAGVRKLRPDYALDRAAIKQAAMMSWQLEVTHYSPLPKSEDPYARVVAEDLRPAKVAENVASLPLLDEATGRPRTYAELAAAFVQAWLNSPGHRFNLLYPDFKSLGCSARAALVPGDVPMVFASQVFFTPAGDGRPPATAIDAQKLNDLH